MLSRIEKYLIISTIFFFSLFISTAWADLNEQRQSFLDAEKAFKAGKQEKFKQLLAGLKDYPLYPYLLFLDIQKNVNLEREKEILSFIDEYGSSPLSNRLRQAWLNYLAGQNQWQRLARDYREPASQSLQCAYARSLFESGEIDKASSQAEKLWLYGKPRPKECDSVFDIWQTHKKLTSDLVRQRIELSMDQDQFQLASHLKQYLPGDEKSWVDLWLNMIRRPADILDTEWAKVDRRVADKILSQAMGILIRQDTPKAALTFDQLKTKQDLSGIDTSRIEREIALYLVLRRHPQALERFAGISDHQMTSSSRQWHMRAALLRQDWKTILSVWDHLDTQQKTVSRWLYWKARALAESDRLQEAASIYQQIVDRQDYFSLLAADRLNQPCQISHRPLTATNEDILKLSREPGIQRAQELFNLGRMTDARKEWIFSLRGKGPSQLRAAALIARDMGWHDRAIIAASDAGEYNDLVIRFPLSYSEYVQCNAKKTGLDPVWVLALIRQESMFIADVRSPAGAMGVMQIMPATGKKIASQLGEHLSHPCLLLSPEKNIRFGTCYLSRCLEKLQNNSVLATAAYNAGIKRVQDWLPEEGSIPADIWVECIPFYETRDYIEKIFTYKTIYRQRLGLEPERLSSQMPMVSSEKTTGKKIVRAGIDEGL